MKKINKKLKIFLWLAVLVALVVAYWLVSPLFIDKKVSEDIPIHVEEDKEDVVVKETEEENGEVEDVEVKEEEVPNDSTEVKDKTDIEISEPSVQPPAKKEAEARVEYLNSGTFEGQAGHRGEGTVNLIKIGDKYYIRMEDDFDIVNGPDLFVHLGRNDQYDPQVNLGPLKGNIGSQNYLIDNPDILNTHKEVWVWCRAFSVPFVKAVLNGNVNSGSLNGSTDTIDLRGQELAEFPRDILSKTGAKILILSNNNLKTLPAEIGQLVNLEELYLDNNQLEGALVAEIRKMPKLRILDASNNNMTGIPAEIGQLQNLTSINYSFNNLDTMPNEIENLKVNLKIMDLSGNRYSKEMIEQIRGKLPDTQVIF